MIAIRGMAMSCQAAKFPIQIIGEYDKNRRWNDQPNHIGGKKMVYY